MLCERAIEHQQNVFLCFIDYQKAFDKVRHNLLLDMLKQIGIDDQDYHIWTFNRKLPSNLLKIFLNGLTLKEVCDRAV